MQSFAIAERVSLHERYRARVVRGSWPASAANLFGAVTNGKPDSAASSAAIASEKPWGAFSPCNQGEAPDRLSASGLGQQLAGSGAPNAGRQ